MNKRITWKTNACVIWNEKYPVGTCVSVTDDSGNVTEDVTRSKAWDVWGSPVIWLEGRTGGYPLERVTPVIV